MPKLNKCIHLVKQQEQIGQRGKYFHFGFHLVRRCKRTGGICIGMHKCVPPRYDEGKKGGGA